jgi:hypothetical protein
MLLVTGGTPCKVTGTSGQVGQGRVIVTVTGYRTVTGVPVAIDPVGMAVVEFVMG